MTVFEEHGVVDAGAQGFVHMLKGISEFIHRGVLHPPRSEPAAALTEVVATAIKTDSLTYRYCTQALIEEADIGSVVLLSEVL